MTFEHFHISTISSNRITKISWRTQSRFFWYTPWSKIAASKPCDSILNFLETCALFSLSATPFYIPTAVLHRASIFPTILPALYVFFLITDTLTGLRCYLRVVLICISLMINDIKCIFRCLLAFCLSSLRTSQNINNCCLFGRVMSEFYSLPAKKYF